MSAFVENRLQSQERAKMGRKEALQRRQSLLFALEDQALNENGQETKEKEAKARARAAKSAMRARSEAELREKVGDEREGEGVGYGQGGDGQEGGRDGKEGEENVGGEPGGINKEDSVQLKSISTFVKIIVAHKDMNTNGQK